VTKRGCPICKGDVRPGRRLEAANCALESATLEYGGAHENVLMRKIDVGIAHAQCGQHLEKRQLLETVTRLKASSKNGWLIQVGRLEHARASLALPDYEQCKRSLRSLWKTRGTKDRFLALLLAEALCLYAKAALHQGKAAAA
jgi:hypothetical protein